MTAIPVRSGDIQRDRDVRDTREMARPTAQVLALAELQDPATTTGRAPVVESMQAFHRVPARLTVSVGEVTVTIGELLGAGENHVLVLDRAVDQPVDILLEGRLVARGELIAVDDRFGVRITETPAPLTR